MAKPAEPFSWDDAFAEIAESNRKSYDASQTPEALARAAQRKAEEHERGVRLGWWREDGTPIEQPDDESDEDQDEDDEE